MRHLTKLAFPIILAIIAITGVCTIVACSKDVEASQIEEIIAEPICNTVSVVSSNNILEIDKNTVTKEYLKSLNAGRHDNTYPTLVWDENGLRVTEYVETNLIDIDKLYDKIKESAPKSTIDVKDFVMSDNGPSMEYDRLVGILSRYINFTIQYTNNECINIYDLKDFVTVSSNTITTHFDSEDFNNHVIELVKEKADKYNTYYNTWEFNSPVNGLVYVKSAEDCYCISTYGNRVDFQKEYLYIKDKICALESETNRVPILLADNESEFINREEFKEYKFAHPYMFEIPNTFIEISIKDQYLWYYVDGELKLKSKVVTGKLDITDTPIGVYQISSMFHGIAFDGGLSGKNWMRFTERGHGLHDATWRPASDFENPETYITNGSHGCINLPLDFSYELYDAVEVGTVVVIY